MGLEGFINYQVSITGVERGFHDVLEAFQCASGVSGHSTRF